MWKFIPRGLRETLERGLNIKRPDGRIKTDTKYINCSILEGFKCIKAQNETYDQHEYKKRTTTYNEKSWLGAVSCSGALALGWILSQPCIFKRWLVNDQLQTSNNLKTKNLVELLTVAAFTQPVGNISNKDDHSVDTTDSAIEFGPRTAEEALNEAVEEFRAVHNMVWGEVENKRGIACLDAKRNHEAVEHFMKSSKRDYPPAAYNLAQCHELGIGTKQDFKEAVKWYQIAASQGHTTAMYNLGVFYAHGWGGLAANTKKARQLFVKAAKKGQPDAIAALGLGEKDKQAETPSIIVAATKMGEKLRKFVINIRTRPQCFRLDLFKEAVKETLYCRQCNNNCLSIDISEDPNELFNLASKYESSINDDSITPSLILQLYKMASELGHFEAKAKLQILQAYDAIGLLPEYLCGKKNKDMKSAEEGISTVHL